LGAFPDILPRCLFENRRAVVAAVSGGSDSTALLLMLKEHIDRNALATRLVAVTVDHQLRPESGAEAEAVARLAASHGIEHRILCWTGDKPVSGIAAAARLARYKLVAGAAGAAGTDIVLTGHTSDDQAETVLMRRQRGEGPGLAGMAPATLFEGAVWICRPLLGTRRAALRAYLKSRGLGWIDDPGNADPRHERILARLALDGAAGDVDALLYLARQAASARIAIGRRAADLVRRHAVQTEPGLIRIDPAFFQEGESAVHAFRILLAVVGGTPHLPDEAAVEALARRLAAPPCRATLSRALIAARRDGVWLCRERRGLPQEMPAEDGTIWDGRYRIFLQGEGRGLLVAPAGANGNVDENDDPPALVRHAARACLPVFRLSKAETEPAPSFASAEHEAPRRPAMSERAALDRLAQPVLAPWATFLPSFDLEPARAVAGLIGAAPVPDAPCAGHNVTQA